MLIDQYFFICQDYDSSSHFGDSTTQSAKPESLTIKLKADKQEIEEFYITVSSTLPSYVLNITKNLISRKFENTY